MYTYLYFDILLYGCNIVPVHIYIPIGIVSRSLGSGMVSYSLVQNIQFDTLERRMG